MQQEVEFEEAKYVAVLTPASSDNLLKSLYEKNKKIKDTVIQKFNWRNVFWLSSFAGLFPVINMYLKNPEITGLSTLVLFPFFATFVFIFFVLFIIVLVAIELLVTGNFKIKDSDFIAKKIKDDLFIHFDIKSSKELESKLLYNSEYLSKVFSLSKMLDNSSLLKNIDYSKLHFGSNILEKTLTEKIKGYVNTENKSVNTFEINKLIVQHIEEISLVLYEKEKANV